MTKPTMKLEQDDDQDSSQVKRSATVHNNGLTETYQHLMVHQQT